MCANRDDGAAFVRITRIRLDAIANAGRGQTSEIIEPELFSAMHVRASQGKVSHGVDAWAMLFRRVWWLWPFGVFLAIPGVRYLAGLGYGAFARHRYCIDGFCRFDPGPGKRRKNPKHCGHRHAAFFELP